MEVVMTVAGRVQNVQVLMLILVPAVVHLVVPVVEGMLLAEVDLAVAGRLQEWMLPVKVGLAVAGCVVMVRRGAFCYPIWPWPPRR